jgi:hypothetical protein
LKKRANCWRRIFQAYRIQNPGTRSQGRRTEKKEYSSQESGARIENRESRSLKPEEKTRKERRREPEEKR